MMPRNGFALLIMLIGLGASPQVLSAELKGVTATFCNQENTKCLRIQSEQSSQSHFASIFTFGKAVVEQVKGQESDWIQEGMVTLDLVNQKLTIFQKLNAHSAKEIQFDLKTLDQKEFLVD